MNSNDIDQPDNSYEYPCFNCIDEEKFAIVEKTFSFYLEYIDAQIEDNECTNDESNNWLYLIYINRFNNYLFIYISNPLILNF